MSALQPEGLIGHQWEADWRLYRGSAPGVANAFGYLRWVSHELGEASTQVVSLWFARPPIQLHHARPRARCLGFV